MQEAAEAVAAEQEARAAEKEAKAQAKKAKAATKEEFNCRVEKVLHP